ncbi:MAG: HAMP domain-containing sensor histidine kinase [Nocardioidaceae bacterium]
MSSEVNANQSAGRTWREPAADAFFVLFSLVGFYLMWRVEEFGTIPFHMIFVVFVAVYGYRVWSIPVTTVALTFLVVGSGSILITQYFQGTVAIEELSEIVLMPTILAAMVWHARRRATLTEELKQIHAEEHERRVQEHEFARNTAHALRTPLTIARGHVELMRDQTNDPQVVSDAAVALGELDRLAQLAGDLLAITRLEQRQSMPAAPCDLSRLVKDAFERMCVAATRQWQLDLDAGLAVIGDTEVFRTCIDALVENAVSATDQGGIIRVYCKSSDESVLFGVADDGPGISETETDNVFRRFWRGGQYPGGTGLGLAFVKAATEAHGGEVLVARSREGGADVMMKLPRLDRRAVRSLPPRHRVGAS